MTPLSKWQRLGQSLATQRQFAAHARRMAPGSLGGRTESASPAPRSAAPVVWSGTAPAALTSGGGSVLGHFALGKNASAAPNALSPANGWTLTSAYGSGIEVGETTGYCYISAAGLWAVGAGLITQGQFADYFLELHRYADGVSVFGDETIERSTNRRQVIGWHFNLLYTKTPTVINSQTIDFRLFHTHTANLGGTISMFLTRFALP